MTTELHGLTTLVTGGASGIGLATATLLAERGADVAVLDLDPSGAPAPLHGFTADVSDDDSVHAAVQAAAAALGGIDILVNNAGIGAAGTVEDNPDAQWHRVLDVNVLGIVRTTRAALDGRQPTGRLVTAQEVATAIAYLASPVAGSTTGTALAVDGGMAGLRLRPELTP
ncbi:SDR family NAD(P)-dependent oxidoreductase [Streptomyces sp. NPDC059460]|uniref:SDR family NAD(P)-dependent oxidoreductase n=1 Tax=Streptomyces sp. NPDC059460 TaxID=3346840 RepID=UPI003675845C